MELTNKQINEISKIFNVSYEFIYNIAQECNNMDELHDQLLKIQSFADEYEIPKDIAEKLSFIKKMIENDNPDKDIEFGVLKIPIHDCPLTENERNCSFCPLETKNLINFSIFNQKGFYKETGKKIDINKVIQIIVYDLTHNPDRLRMFIKESHDFHFKNSINEN